MVLAVVSLVRFPTVYDLDAEYLVSRTLPGGVKASVPATWYAYRDESAGICFQSPVYPARVDVRALRMEDAVVFFAEWQRIQRGGFQPGTPWQGAFFWMLALYETSRIEVPMIGPAHVQRHQVFIRLKDDVLLSLGIQAAMKVSGDFAPVQVRILESLPHTRHE